MLDGFMGFYLVFKAGHQLLGIPVEAIRARTQGE